MTDAAAKPPGCQDDGVPTRTTRLALSIITAVLIAGLAMGCSAAEEPQISDEAGAPSSVGEPDVQTPPPPPTPQAPAATEVAAQCAKYAEFTHVSQIDQSAFIDQGIVAALSAADAVPLCVLSGRSPYGYYEGGEYQTLVFWQADVEFPGANAASWLQQVMSGAGYAVNDPAGDTTYTKPGSGGGTQFTADGTRTAMDDDPAWWRGGSWVINIVAGDAVR